MVVGDRLEDSFEDPGIPKSEFPEHHYSIPETCTRQSESAIFDKNPVCCGHAHRVDTADQC